MKEWDFMIQGNVIEGWRILMCKEENCAGATIKNTHSPFERKGRAAEALNTLLKCHLEEGDVPPPEFVRDTWDEICEKLDL